MIPDEESVRRWLEEQRWEDTGRFCPRCGSVRTREATHKTMPYWYTDCRSYFSVRTNTPIERSNIPLLKWVWAIYLYCTHTKSIRTRKLAADIGVSQTTAWFMLQRIREAYDEPESFVGPVEVDETYVGGIERFKHARKRVKGTSGTAGRRPSSGCRDRTTGQLVARTLGYTLVGFVKDHTTDKTMVYTDGEQSYRALPKHAYVNHGSGEYIRGRVHAIGIESM